MKRYTFSVMNRFSGEILETATIEPVVPFKYGKEKLFVLSVGDYHRMRGEPSPTKAYLLDDAPNDVHQELMSG